MNFIRSLHPLLMVVALFIANPLLSAQTATTTAPLHDAHETKKKNILVFDFDEVIIDVNKVSLGAYVSWLLVTNPALSWKLLTNGSFYKNIKNSLKKEENKDTPFSLRLAAVMQRYPKLTHLYDPIIKRFSEGRYLFGDVIAYLKAAKDQGYTIFIATNRDRLTFEITAQALGLDQLYKGGRLFDHVITVKADNFIAATTDKKGRRFSKLAINPAYNTYISEVPASKPNAAYYQFVRAQVDQYAQQHPEQFATDHPRIIFFDDKIENVTGAMKAQSDIIAYQIPNKNRGAVIGTKLSKELGFKGLRGLWLTMTAYPGSVRFVQ